MTTARVTAVGLAFGTGLLLGHLSAHNRTAALRAELRAAQCRADHDPLTGLLNRHGAHRHLTKPTHAAGTIVLIDLDQFKQLNDRHGHRAGDALLAEIGRRLSEEAGRLNGLAGRLGGDEFLLSLPLAEGSSVEVVESVLGTLTRPVSLDLPDTPLAVYPGLSAGLAARNGQPWTEALHRADIALYHAKSSPHRLIVHTPGMRHPTRRARLRDQLPDERR